jgi:hypothetical protein
MSGKMITGLPCGGKMWEEKADIIKLILKKDREATRVPFWGNKEVQLPRGMAMAVKAVAWQDELDDAPKRLKELEQSGDASQKEKLGLLRTAAGNWAEITTASQRNEAYRAVVVCRAFDTLREQKKATKTLGARKLDLVSASDAVKTAMNAIKTEFGEEAFSS